MTGVVGALVALAVVMALVLVLGVRPQPQQFPAKKFNLRRIHEWFGG